MAKPFIALVRCNSCGAEFEVAYFPSGVFCLDTPCDCDSDCDPCCDYPSYTEWRANQDEFEDW